MIKLIELITARPAATAVPLRNCDGKKVTEAHVKQLAGWKPNAQRTDEIPFVVARIVPFAVAPQMGRSPQGTAYASCLWLARG